ncbi:uncharacterized protein LOC105391071 [Plutella xylostella]|uniref:uncharacterized protein LOC105391071 n=1 Tax=Plutella xylostella TaxID=51655 RepID=UPI0020327495|nr:uncharacterized protein LOC105391071 [Plutella xylostella]
MTSPEPMFERRRLPKLMPCMTKNSLETMRNKALFNMTVLDARSVRRLKMPLHECLILELQESGYTESAAYLQDLIYDNLQLMAEDELGIITDLRQKHEFLEHICAGLRNAEKEQDRGNIKEECLEFLNLGLYFAEHGKGLLWLAEKLFLVSIAIASKYLVDGGRQKAVNKFHYAKFLLEKFPEADTEEAYQVLSEVRDASNGKKWQLYEATPGEAAPTNKITVFIATANQLLNVLLHEARKLRTTDVAKAERLCRLAERRATDTGKDEKISEAILEMGICQLKMNSLNNAQKSFEKSLQINTNIHNIEGICDARMHLAAVLQKLGDHEAAAEMLTEMGALAWEHHMRRHLGTALHLLGELHLKSGRPELGTQHLGEAFNCFMGKGFEQSYCPCDGSEDPLARMTDLNVVYKQEAEQARLMMAVSAGQELMSSYFALIREAGSCSVARMQVIEWKLNRRRWTEPNEKHNLIPCPCPKHQRTAMDVLDYYLKLKGKEEETQDLQNPSSSRDLKL